MSLREVRRRVVARLSQADRGDRGWFLITRVHLNTARLKDIAVYLYDRGGAGGPVELRSADYEALARVAGVTGADPGITLRRHYLLAMEKPLNLIRRIDEPHWNEINLTTLGIALATHPNASEVLENALAEIRFCRQPWYPATRVREYRDFDVRAYPVTLNVMEACEGWVDRDEYDLFVSRIRATREARWAIAGIHQFRGLSAEDRDVVLTEVRRRVPSAKRYQNWRDMALHTFSLFHLGRSAIRVGQRLRLVTTFLEPQRQATRGPTARPRPVRPLPAVRIPTPRATPELAVPPTGPAINPGSDAELLLGKLLTAAGWEIAYYTNRRGFGFDLWARRGPAAIVIEVKSSFGQLGSITLTELEYQAARHYGENYLLAAVEHVGTETPLIRLIQNPVQALLIQERTTREYHVAHRSWVDAAVPLDL